VTVAVVMLQRKLLYHQIARADNLWLRGQLPMPVLVLKFERGEVNNVRR